MIKRAAHISPAYYGLCERGWKRLPSKAHPTIEVLKIEPTFPVLVFPPHVGATHPYEQKFVLTIWYREQPEKPEQPKRTPTRPLPLP
jgi:hypothetical protein